MTNTTDMSTFATTISQAKYLRGDEKEWVDVAQRVAQEVVGPYFPEFVEPVAEAIANREFMPGGRFLANAGYSNMNNNCYLFRIDDHRDGIADFFRKGMVVGMTGGGVGAVWSDLRPRGGKVMTNGGTSTGPCSFMQGFNELGRAVVNGGGRRMAIWAGLHWWHPDVFEFMSMKDWDERTVESKAENFSAYAPMDMTNISIILDTAFFEAMEDENFEHTVTWTNDAGEVVSEFTADHEWAMKVYYTAVEKMLKTGEPGFSIDAYENEGENLRNPCTEITSYDDSDICCLGSINLARVDTIERMQELTELGTLFLLCGTLASEVPLDEVMATRHKNRRLGLGVMGIHEWLLARGYRYEGNPELGEWMAVWAKSTKIAHAFADELGVSRPVKTRAVAPTGTIGIIAGTTTGVEPVFAAAYKRRYITDGSWKYQYVIDPTAERLIEQYGLKPDELETAADLANDPDRRLAMQVFVQSYTDHAISSTLNLPAFEEQSFSVEEFAEMLYHRLPDLRGITAYPDGARGGQPLNVVSYEEALLWGDAEYEEFGLDQACVNGVCGI